MAQAPKTPETELINKAKKAASTLSDEVRAYVILAIGVFLFLFSIGYFDFLKVMIGVLGFGMVVWGSVHSRLLSKITDWINQLLSKK